MLKFSGYSRLISCQCSEWPPGPVQGSTPSVQRRDPRTATYSGSIQVRWQAPVFPASVTTPPRGRDRALHTPPHTHGRSKINVLLADPVRGYTQGRGGHPISPKQAHLQPVRLEATGARLSSPPCATHGVLAKRALSHPRPGPLPFPVCDSRSQAVSGVPRPRQAGRPVTPSAPASMRLVIVCILRP